MMIEQFVVDRLLDGVLYGGATCLMGFGCAVAIDLLKLFGGIR